MHIKRIQSFHNPVIKQTIALHAKKGRDQSGLFIAEGIRTCAALYHASVPLERLIITEEMEAHIESYNVSEVLIVPPELMRKISTAESPSGIIGIYKKPPKPTAPLTPGIVLAQISDPGNMGTLIRTAAAVNVKTVVIVEGCDPWNPKVIQASAGTIGQVHVHEYNWNELMSFRGSTPLGALVASGGVSITEVPALTTYLLVVGNEAHGLPPAWEQSCDRRITLPMPGNTESLNAAVAGSIALYLAHIPQ